MYIYIYIYTQRYVFRSSQDSLVWHGLTSRVENNYIFLIYNIYIYIEREREIYILIDR